MTDLSSVDPAPNQPPIEVLRAAREWAAEHNHQTPDDRMLAIVFAAGRTAVAADLAALDLDARDARVRAEALREAYWKLRKHASGYRGTKVLRVARERWEASDRRDERLFHKVSIHEHYARGVESAARDIAEMLGVPEHEIEPASTDGEAS